VGSAGQKTWNLRRPVTLIGSSRPAHIVLHDREIAKAHCVIINTGTEVLIKDLNTQAGTFCNRNRVELAVLTDGDLVTIGENNIQVAIQLPEDAANDSNCGMQFVDPVKFARPVVLRLIHTDTSWNVEDAVVLIGRLDEASIRLDHDDVSSRHAVLFRFADGPAVFDLGSRAGIWVNGKRTSMSTLADGDCLTVGPFGLSVACAERSPLEEIPAASPLGPDSSARPATVASEAGGPRNGHGVNSPDVAAIMDNFEPPGSAPLAAAPPISAAAPECSKAAQPNGHGLDTNLEQVWDKLNAWDPQVETERAAKAQIEADLTARIAELDARETGLEARDGALRGQLHDVTRFHEQVLERERDLARARAELQTANDALSESQRIFEAKEAELAQLAAEVHRRENALAQRWTRIRSATCPHCGNPTNLQNLMGEGS